MHVVHLGLTQEVDPQLVADLTRALLFQKIFREDVPPRQVRRTHTRPRAFACGVCQNLRDAKRVLVEAW